MKHKLKQIVVGVAAMLAVSETHAVITLSLEPVLQSTGVGGSASVNIIVSGLGDLSAPSIGGFDIDLIYNPVVVSASSLTFGTFLDLGTFGSTQFANLSTPGLVHLDEVSFETAMDLNDSQPDSFILGTLGFTGLNPGLSPLAFGAVTLSDENGSTIEEFAINTAAIEVVGGNNVPEAGATLWLLSGACAGMLLLHTRRPSKTGLLPEAVS